MIEIRHLRYFIAVAEELNFSRAAERLHMAQPPLSQQIQALENKLKLQLFERKKRRVQLTAAGQVFLEEARLMCAQMEKAIVSARKASQGETGQLVVGANSSVANSLLPEILQAFRDRFPTVRLMLREITSYQQVQELYNCQIDVGFDRWPNVNDNTAVLNFMPIFQEPLVIALHEKHPLANQSQIPLDALADEPFVLPSPDIVASYSQIISLCEQVGFSPKVVQEAVWMVTVLGLVAGGIGVTLLPANAQSLQRKGVVYKPIQGKNLTLQLAAVWRRDDSSAILHNFLEVTKNVAQTHQSYGMIAPLEALLDKS